MKRRRLFVLLTLSLLLACLAAGVVRAASAYGTLVAVPGGVREMQSLAVGDQVQVVSSYTRARKPGERLQLEWASVPVFFSEGEPPPSPSSGELPQMVFLAYSGGTRDLVVSRDQPLMRAEGTMTTAGQLHAGEWLATANAGAAAAGAGLLTSVSIGQYNGGVHHISAGSRDRPASPAGHLIVMNGVIAGDYVVEMYFPTMPKQ